MKVYGQDVLLEKYPCRFPQVQEKNDKGNFQIEIVVPKKEAKAVQDALYGNDERIIDFNKATPSAKLPKKLHSPLYLYDEESKTPLYDEEGEKVESPDFVVFRFKSQWRPKIQFKKGLDSTAKIGAGSVVQIKGALFGSDEKRDENGKPLKYMLLSLKGLRVFELVEQTSREVFEDSDEFEDEYVEEVHEETSTEKPKGTTDKQF